MNDEKVVRDWFVRLLADFRIYSPLYKVTVMRQERSGFDVNGEVAAGEIYTFVTMKDGQIVDWTGPTMTYRGGLRELARTDREAGE